MHSMRLTLDEDVFDLSYNSDLSGDVRVELPEKDYDWDPVNKRVTVLVPGEVFISLVAEYVRAEKISRLEQAGDSEVLGL